MDEQMFIITFFCAFFCAFFGSLIIDLVSGKKIFFGIVIMALAFFVYINAKIILECNGAVVVGPVSYVCIGG